MDKPFGTQPDSTVALNPAFVAVPFPLVRVVNLIKSTPPATFIALAGFDVYFSVFESTFVFPSLSVNI